MAILTVSWLGKWSDLLGRRKPFILALCLLLIASLLLLIAVQNLLAVEGTNAFGLVLLSGGADFSVRGCVNPNCLFNLATNEFHATSHDSIENFWLEFLLDHAT